MWSTKISIIKFNRFMKSFIATSVRENIDDDSFVRVDEGSSS